MVPQFTVADLLVCFPLLHRRDLFFVEFLGCPVDKNSVPLFAANGRYPCDKALLLWVTDQKYLAHRDNLRLRPFSPLLHLWFGVHGL